MKSTEMKRVEEQERLTYWRGLSAQQKVQSLNSRLGTNQGAFKQRKRLEKQLALEKEGK